MKVPKAISGSQSGLQFSAHCLKTFNVGGKLCFNEASGPKVSAALFFCNFKSNKVELN